MSTHLKNSLTHTTSSQASWKPFCCFCVILFTNKENNKTLIFIFRPLRLFPPVKVASTESWGRHLFSFLCRDLSWEGRPSFCLHPVHCFCIERQTAIARHWRHLAVTLFSMMNNAWVESSRESGEISHTRRESTGSSCKNTRATPWEHTHTDTHRHTQTNTHWNPSTN